MKRQVRLGKWLVLAALGLVSFAPVTGSAAVPTGITQQGRVLDANGEAISGDVTMVFTAYDEATDGNSLWTETQDITLDEGYFSARLGEDGDNPFPADFFDGSVRFIGITIGADEELQPRERIASVPYAYHALEVTGDIHPSSVTVGGVEVIDATGSIPVARITGKLPATQLTGFSSLLTAVATTGIADTGIALATAACGAGNFATGGGCVVTGCTAASPSGFMPKENNPTLTGGKPTGWECSIAILAASGSPSCTVRAHAVCASDN